MIRDAEPIARGMDRVAVAPHASFVVGTRSRRVHVNVPTRFHVVKNRWFIERERHLPRIEYLKDDDLVPTCPQVSEVSFEPLDRGEQIRDEYHHPALSD